MSGPEEAENLHHAVWERQQPEPTVAPNAGAPARDAMLERARMMGSWAWDTNQDQWGQIIDFLLAEVDAAKQQAAERIAALERELGVAKQRIEWMRSELRHQQEGRV